MTKGSLYYKILDIAGIELCQNLFSTSPAFDGDALFTK